MKALKGKTAFVTGGASGVGLGLARAFAEEGMNVVIADIRDDHISNAMEALDDVRAQITPIKLDVADRDAFPRIADEAEEKAGPVSVLCNNAGINFFSPMDECTFDDWDWIIGVNFWGVVNGVQTFVPRMKKRGEGGHIVNTASMAAFISGPGAGIYTTSKFAVRGLSESLRWSVAPYGIGVSVLCPGLVASAIHDSDRIRPKELSIATGPTDPEFYARLEALHQLGMNPREVAAATIAGIRENMFYIFSHPEFKEEVAEIFQEALDSMPEGEGDPKRLQFEIGRRAAVAEARKHLNDKIS